LRLIFRLIFHSDHNLDDAAEVGYILHLLAHRGDGDWSLHYREGLVGLRLLHEARNHPGTKIIKRAVDGDPATTSSKGKAKVADLDDATAAGPSSGQRPTAYSGVSLFSDHLQTSFTLLRG
jgi:hypothetical protein